MNATLMSGSSTGGDKRAMNILRELYAAEEELVGRAVVLTDGKAGTIDHVFLTTGTGCASRSEDTRADGRSRR